MKVAVLFLIWISPDLSEAFSQCNKTKLDPCVNTIGNAFGDSSSQDFQSIINMYCSPTIQSAIICVLHESVLCPEYLANLNDLQRSYLQNTSINDLNVYCHNIQNLSSETISCFSKAFRVTFPPTPGGYMDCMMSDPVYNATITSGRQLTDLCWVQALQHKCAVQQIHNLCPDHAKDYNNYFKLTSTVMFCPNMNDLAPIVG